jgi:YD repeat-containing protein
MRKTTLTSLIFLFILGFAPLLRAQGGASVQYVYDALGRLTKVVDPSGNVATYNYDAVGNLLSITSSATSPTALAIFGFTPAQGSVGQTIAIQGQNFSATPSANTVQFNGTTATISGATANSLTVTVPAGATTGPISVTVGSSTATSSSNFTVLSVPVITSVSPTLTVQTPTISSFQVTGSNLTGAAFSFAPAFTPPAITISNVVINSNGTSATMTLTLASNAAGSFTLVATNATGSSPAIPSASNTLTILSSDPNVDFDGDGLTNIYEVAIGSNYANSSTTGDGIPDGWAVFYGLNPLNAAAASQTAANGLTYLQSFQRSLNPLIPNLVPPAVSNIFPANGTTSYPTNGVVVVRFNEALLGGIDLLTAQKAINAGLPAQSNFSSTNALAAAQVLQAYLQRTCCGTTAVPGVVQVFQNGRLVPGSVSLSNDRLSITWAPTRLLSSSTTFTVIVQNVRDAAGNLMTQTFQSAFTTGAAAYRLTPGVAFTNPLNGATGVPINTPIQVEFSAPVNPATVTPQTFSVQVPGMLQVDAYGYTASFVPAQPYPVGQQIIVTLSSGIQDVFGNSIPASTLSFTTGFAPDNQGFNLVGTCPSNGFTGVPLNSVVVLEFDEPADAISALTGLQVQLAGVPISGAIALSDGNKRITFTPTAPLVANSTYSVVATGLLTDFAGNQLSNPSTSTFTTGSTSDTTSPQVVAVAPANGASGVPTNQLIQLQFSKRINPFTVTSSTFAVFPFSAQSFPVAGSYSVSPDGLSATFTPASQLVPGTLYAIGPRPGITDLEGHALQSFCSPYCYTFTTGNGAATAAPTVLAISPANGTVGVQVNARVDVLVSAAVSAPSVGTNAITVSAGGVPVAGTISVSSDRSTVTFVPTSLLAVSTSYTVSVSGFTDQAGNAVVPFTSSFTTGTSGVPDTSAPAVVSMSPASGATGVPINSTIVLTFNKNVDPSTVNNGTIAIALSGALNPVLAGSYAVNGGTVTFTPLSPLPGSTLVFVGVYSGGVKDLAGNGTSNGGGTFTTAAVTDTTPPQVVAVTPNNGATGIGLNAKVVLTFSKSLNPSTINSSTFGLLANGTNLHCGTTYSFDTHVVTLISGTLPALSTITVLATSGVRDLSGNALPNFQSQFTTAAGIDATNPSVVSQRPGNGSTGVPLNAGVVLYVNEPMNPATVSGALHISQNGVLVSGTTQVTDSGQVIQFTPSAPFQSNALIQVFLDSTALDADGDSLASYQGSFTTLADTTTVPPSVAATSPLYGATGVPTNVLIDIGFNEALNPSTVNSTTVNLLQGGSTAVPIAVSLVGGGTVIQITPNAVLTANTSYLVQLTTGLQGVNGLALQFAGTYLSFTTGAGTDTVNPTVVLVSPPNGAVNVGDNANIRVRFSKTINPFTVSAAAISISGGSASQVSYATSFAGNDVVIVPYAPLPDAAQMTVAISGITDLAGNTVIPQSTHFTTGTGPDTTIPVVLGTNPLVFEQNVPLNTPIILQINEPVDPGTVNASTLSIQDQTTLQQVPGTYSVSASGQTISFVPSAPLAVNRTYKVSDVNLGITDLAGNLLTAGRIEGFFGWAFTTGTTANTAQPQVIGVSPANGLAGVPINAQVVIQFNEPVDAFTVNQVSVSGAGAVNVTRTLSNGNQTLVLVPVVPLNPSTSYTVTITGVLDVSGNSLAVPVTTTFTTGTGPDLTALTVVSVNPALGATGVPTNTIIQLRFNKRIDPLTVTNTTFLVSATPGQPIAAAITISADGLTATLTPATPLQPETSYIATGGAITDLEGQLQTSCNVCSIFTTGVSVVTSGPTVVGVSPANGTVGVQVNARVDVVVSAPVSAPSVGSNAITVSAGGVPVVGTVSVGSSGTTLTFTPSSLLAVSTVYTVSVSGFTDQAGNAVAPITTSFTTGTSGVPDTSAPAVVSVSPANGATGVAVNSTIVLTFNKNIDPSTVNNTAIPISQAGFTGDLAGTYAVNGTTVTFTPLSVWPGSATVQVAVNGGVLDLAGNPSGSFSSSFTTSVVNDTTPPQVVSVTPNNGATGIGPNVIPVLTFSKSLNPTTINANTFGLLANGANLNANPGHSADNRVVTLTPNSAVPASSTVTVVATNGVTDLSGNALANFESQFATASAFDTTHASVVGQRPGNGSTVVPLNTSVVLYISEPMNTSTISGALHISQNGVLVNGTTQVSSSGQVIQFTPASSWQNSALIQVFLDSTAKDMDGASLANYQGSFITATGASTVAPSVVSTSPVNGAANVPTNVVIDIGFNETLNPATVNSTTVSLIGSTTISTSVSLIGGGTIIQINPTATLTANTAYCVQLTTGIQGTNGIAFPFFSNICFTTGPGTDTVVPTVIIVSPSNGMVNVGDNANLRVFFSKAINPLSINSSTISVSGGSVQLPYTTTYFVGQQEVLIVPYAPLPDATQMTVAISGVTDLAGNLVVPLTTHFTTGTGPDLVTPVVVNTNPYNGALAVPLNVVIMLQANKPLDPGTVKSSTLIVTDTVTRQAVPGSYSVSTDGRTISFVPGTLLTASRTYSVTIGGTGIIDLVGNFLSGGSNFLSSFTTGTTTSSTGPQVVGVSPPNGLTGVPINAQVAVQFNVPVDALTVNQVTLSSGSAVNVTSTLLNGNQTLLLTPTVPLNSSTSYTLAITGVQDMAGNSSATTTSTFTTGTGADVSLPTVASFSPPNGATAVLTHTVVQVQFSKRMNPFTITNSTFYVALSSTGQKIAGTITVSTDGLTATFTPAAALATSTTYQIVFPFLTNRVTDIEGQPLGGSTSSIFTTGTQ